MKRMSRALDLEALRHALSDNRVHIAIGLVKQVEVLSDRSKCRALISVFPEEYEVIAEETYDALGPEAGIFNLPVANDLVLVGFVSEDQAFILRKLSTKEDKLPTQAEAGHLVVRSRSGKKAHVIGAAGVFIGSGDTEPDEPLVLGSVLLSALGDLMDQLVAVLDGLISGPIGIGNLGNPVPTFPALSTSLGTIKAQVETLKSTYVETAATNVVSGKHFTER